MTRVLLTGGTGFIAAHVLDTLLARGHSVVTTVRSMQKAQTIRNAHPNVPKDWLDFSIVEDIAHLNAFNEAVISDPPFEAVIHTASPYHFNPTDIKKDLLDPAIIGTTGILAAIKRNAPTVKRVVITSSSAAITDPAKSIGVTYSEADWNPITETEAYDNASQGYRASKTFAEKAAWDFVIREEPNFTLATCNPPLVLGPVVHYLASLDATNTSNKRIRDLMTGAAKARCPPTGNFLWVDVRDVAWAHVRAMELDAAAGKRFFLTAGHFCNKEIAEIMRDEYPDLRDKLPSGDALASGDYPKEGRIGYDNRRSRELLGIRYRGLRESVVDAVAALRAVGGVGEE